MVKHKFTKNYGIAGKEAVEEYIRLLKNELFRSPIYEHSMFLDMIDRVKKKFIGGED